MWQYSFYNIILLAFLYTSEKDWQQSSFLLRERERNERRAAAKEEAREEVKADDSDLSNSK